MGVQHDDIDHTGITGVGGSLTVEDEGTPLATGATTLDFVGAGVTASGTGAEKTITIPGGGLAFSGAKVYTTGVSITAAVVTFASEVYDTDTYHDTGSNTSRLTVPATGTYFVVAGGFVSRTDCRPSFRINGAAVIGGNKMGNSTTNYHHISDFFQLTSGQYIEVFANTIAATTFGDNSNIGDNYTFAIMRVA